MKLLSIAIPCYNSQDYMAHCIESLLPGGEDVEILIVNDGSKDDTAKIADEYAAKYPTIVKAIHKENGGHGSAGNTGIENATGIYFKVVDSDDWVKEDAYLAILEKLRELTGGVDTLDLLISNFVYEKEGERRKKVMRYKHVLPEYRRFGWEEVGRFLVGLFILMLYFIYRTKLLRECGLKLPEHTFYVDNIYVFEPLPYVRNMYYLDVNFYRYFIGRSDQSVNEKVMTGRIDQQIKVNQIMTDYFVEKKSEIMGNKPLAKYMLSYLDIITTISSILLIRINTPESLEKKRELLNYIRQKDKKVYGKLRYGLLGNCMNLPGKTGRWISVEGYKICQKFFGFN